MPLTQEHEPSAPSAHASLEIWQQTLLAALWAPSMEDALNLVVEPEADPNPHLRRGMAAYRSHATLQSARVLAAAYPAIESILGEENFLGLARSLWRAHPPRRGDLGRWGEELAGHIENLRELAEAEPYLSDVARLEWALHSAERAADDHADTASFELLTKVDPAGLDLVLAPGAGSLQSRWPVVSMLEAHRQDKGPACLPDIGGKGETAVYWRGGWRGRVRHAQTGEAAFLATLRLGRSLAAALAGADTLDFGAWLTAAVEEGLLLRALERSPATPTS